ncbi:MAG: patatin-like phospholipase family protein [Rhodospirillales bacterium]
MGVKKVAIACQGGGTHAAFTWGILTEILRTKKRWQTEASGGDTFEVVAISGTSAGALCALATWYGLVPNTADRECGTIDKAIERLDFLWTTFTATTPAETLHNQMMGNLLQLKAKGVPFPGSSPYSVSGSLGLAGLSIMGARPEYLEFPALLRSLCPNFATIDWAGVSRDHIRIVVGAIEVLSGNFEIFDSDKTLEQAGLMPSTAAVDQYNETRWRMRRPLSLEGVAASGTLPEILPAQTINDMVFPTCEPGKTVTRNGYYWDGLFSQNPPVRDLLDAETKEDKPDEIWIVRINPQEFYPGTKNIGLEDIRDRENDLAGNLSLNQELDHILTVNRWIMNHGNDRPPLNKCKPVTVRTIKMTQDTAWGLRHTSKFDRNVRHLESLRNEGTAVAEQWLKDWRTQGDAFASYPNDARYPELA